MNKIPLIKLSLFLFLLAASCQSGATTGKSLSIVSPVVSSVDLTISSLGYVLDVPDSEYSGVSLRYEVESGASSFGAVFTPEAEYSFKDYFWIATGEQVRLTSPEFGLFGRKYFDNVFIEGTAMLGTGTKFNTSGSEASDMYSYARMAAGVRADFGDQFFGDISIGYRFDILPMGDESSEIEVSGYDVFLGVGYNL